MLFLHMLQAPQQGPVAGLATYARQHIGACGSWKSSPTCSARL